MDIKVFNEKNMMVKKATKRKCPGGKIRSKGKGRG